MIAIWKKELHQYRVSMTGAVFLASYGGLIGYYFVVGNLLAMNGDITILFQSVYSTLLMLIPVLTMRLFAEDKGQYSVPSMYINKYVDVQYNSSRVSIYASHKLIAEHKRLPAGIRNAKRPFTGIPYSLKSPAY